MLAHIKTSVIHGINAVPVSVEGHIQKGKQQFIIVGLADTAVREARQRVESALLKSGCYIKDKIVVNLAPAEIKKEGTIFDLPIAIALLAAAKKLSGLNLDAFAFYGELSLDGTLKGIRSITPHLIYAKQAKLKGVFIPYANRYEGSLFKDINIIPVQSLQEVIKIIKSGDLPQQKYFRQQRVVKQEPLLSEVCGQAQAKRALMIAAAGQHNLLFIGPPGCGKSMLAERLPGLLPKMSYEEMLDCIKIHSIAGQDIDTLLAARRPYRSPHHVVSEQGLIGGGSTPKPGEISLAHNGVLFLDEFPEFKRHVIEALRAPLENKQVQITRVRSSVEFPAQFQLIAAMNPCPCGKLGSEYSCSCSHTAIQSYLKKLSQPILDRIDLHVELEAVSLSSINASANLNSDQKNKEKVENAYSLAMSRNKGLSNSSLSNQEIMSVLNATTSVMQFFEDAAKKNLLTVRSYFRMLKVARTIADLENAERVLEEHIAEAFSYRNLEKIGSYCGLQGNLG